MEKVVSVLGMHRSGTSLVARILNILGVYLGPEEELLERKPDNPEGFWELKPIIQLNEELLVRCGGTMQDPPSFPPGWESDASLSPLLEQARLMLEEHFTRREVWGWKDPRTCLTLPFWRRLVEPTHYVFCIRNPMEVAHSLRCRDGFPPEMSGRLWLEYTSSGLRNTAGAHRLVVFYEDIMDDWRGEAQRLKDFIGLSGGDEDTLANAVRMALRHHRALPEEVVGNLRIPFASRSLYATLRASHPPPRGGANNASFTRSSFLDDFAEYCQLGQREADLRQTPASLIEPVQVSWDDGRRFTALPLATRSAVIPVQVFWEDGGRFTAESSAERPFLCDGATRNLMFEIPPFVRGPIRVDPGTAILYGEVESASIYAICPDTGGVEGQHLIATWFAGNSFDGVLALHQVLPIPGAGPYRFITLGGDPQLAFTVPQWPESAASYLFEIRMRLYADLREAEGIGLSALVDALERAHDAAGHEQQLRVQAEQRLSETEQALVDARSRAEREERARAEAESAGLRMQREREEAVAELGAQLTLMGARLQTTSDELGRIKATRGWRLLSAYGRVKHALRRALR
jgi:hypothetical protein